MKKIKQVFLKKIFFYSCAFFLVLSYNNPSYSKSILEITEDDFFIGDVNAPITIIEYASLSCSHCANFHMNTLPKLVEQYVDTGKVKFVFRDFPFNYPALMGSMVLQCIDTDIRYQYSSALYSLQSKWVVRENKKSKQELYKIMQTGGMTKEQFNQCLANENLEKIILQGLIDAQNEFNIKSTPSFLINGTLLEGNKTIKDFNKILDPLLLE